MQKSIRSLIASCAVAALVVSPIATGAVFLSAEDAVAKAGDKKKAKTGSGNKAKAQKKAKKDKTAKVKQAKPEKIQKVKSEKPTKPNAKPTQASASEKDFNTNDGSFEDADQKDLIAAEDERIVILKDSDDEPFLGNPGNDKAVGRAGETPNGDENGWGEGTRGRSDADRNGDSDDDDDLFDDVFDDNVTDGEETDDGIEAADLLVPEAIFENTDNKQNGDRR